jgi:hypothetical protein
MLVPFRFIDGSISAPGLTFNNEPTSGIYRAGLNDVRVSIGTQDVLKFTLAGVTIPAGKTLSGSITGTITGGSINNTPIGDVTPSTGAFTTVNASGQINTGITGGPNSGCFQLARRDTGVAAWTMYSAGGNFQWYDQIADRWSMTPGAASTLTGPTLSATTSVVTPSVSSPSGTLSVTGALSVSGSISVSLAHPAQYAPLLNVRSPGANVEFGHSNLAGYGSVLGGEYSNGNPFLSFSCGPGTAPNTYLTLGLKGSGICGDLNGGLIFFTVPNANADNQARVQIGSLQTNGTFITKSLQVTSDNTLLGAADDSTKLIITGLTKAIRFSTTPTLSAIEGVDQTGSASYQPIQLNGSTVTLANSGNALLQLTTPNFQPVADLGINLGSPANRWFTAYTPVVDSGPGSLTLKVNAVTQVDVRPGGTDRNLTLSGGTSGGAGEHGYIGVTGGGSLAFLHDSTGAPVRSLVLNYLAAAARWLTITPAIGSGNPAIGTSGGSVNFSAPVIFSAGFSGFPVPSFESAELAIAANTIQTVAHGLGRVPKLFSAVIRCKTAELGYAVGDEVAYTTSLNSDSATFSDPTIWANATTLGIGWAAQPFVLNNIATHGAASPTLANWKVVLRAW